MQRLKRSLSIRAFPRYLSVESGPEPRSLGGMKPPFGMVKGALNAPIPGTEARPLEMLSDPRIAELSV